jgi:hypothetical protein
MLVVSQFTSAGLFKPWYPLGMMAICHASVLRGEGTLANEINRLVQCRNYAEVLRTIAADQATLEDHEALLRVADDYDSMAITLEAILKAKA